MFHMILIGLIIGAVVAFMVTFWREITEWLKTCIKAIKERNWKGVLYGTKVFLQKVGRKFKRIADHYSKLKDSDKWMKSTTIEEELVDPDEVPEDILMRAQNDRSDKTDISDKYEQVLENSN